jgi:hypothetical protein
MFEFISKKIADIKILHEGYTADYFLNRMKPNALFPILFIQNNKKKNQVPTFFIRLLHMCILEKFCRVIFCFLVLICSIFVTQLVAKHMKEIIIYKKYYIIAIEKFLLSNFHPTLVISHLGFVLYVFH